MSVSADRKETSAPIQTALGAIFASLELSRSKWLVTSISPGRGEKMSKFVLSGGDVTGLLAQMAELRRKAHASSGQDFPIVSI